MEKGSHQIPGGDLLMPMPYKKYLEKIKERGRMSRRRPSRKPPPTPMPSPGTMPGPMSGRMPKRDIQIEKWIGIAFLYIGGVITGFALHAMWMEL